LGSLRAIAELDHIDRDAALEPMGLGHRWAHRLVDDDIDSDDDIAESEYSEDVECDEPSAAGRAAKALCVADRAAYRAFIGSVIWTLPGVRETRTYVVMEEVKNSTLLAV